MKATTILSALALAFLLGASVTVAQQKTTPVAPEKKATTAPATTAQKQEAAVAQTNPTEGEVVSVDAKAKTITIRTPDGKEVTAPLTGKAVTEASRLKTGEKVALTWHESNRGGPASISRVRVEKQAHAKASTPRKASSKKSPKQ